MTPDPSEIEKTIKKFWRYHLKNPHIYEAFKEEATSYLKEENRTYYSADHVMSRMRWETPIEEAGTKFKISDRWTAFYARMYEYEHPFKAGVFRRRASIADHMVFEVGPGGGIWLKIPGDWALDLNDEVE